MGVDDGVRDSESVVCAETPLFPIKGFGNLFLFIYSPTQIDKEDRGLEYSSSERSSGMENNKKRSETMREKAEGRSEE